MASGSIPGLNYEKKFYELYRGIVVKNNTLSPEPDLKCKVFIPDISPIPISLMQKFKTLMFRFPGKNNTQDNWSDTPEFENMVAALPWAKQCAPLMGEHGPGRYYAPEGTAVMTDTNFPDGFETNNTTPPTLEDYTGPPSFFFGLEGASNDAFDGSNEFVASNPYTNMYTPQNYENAPKGVFGVPMVGAEVWVMHERGDLLLPTYIGGISNSRETALIYNSTGEEGQSLDYPGTFENVPQQNQGTGSGSGTGSEEEPWYEIADAADPRLTPIPPGPTRAPILMGEVSNNEEFIGPPDPKTLPRVTTESLEYGSAEYIIKRLKDDHGLTEIAAIGVVGNLQVESGLDPTKKQVKGPGVGIAQWTKGGRFGRWDKTDINLVDYAKERGRDPYDLDLQIDFIAHELNEHRWTKKDDLMKATTVEESTRIFMEGYEKPNPDKDHYDRREAASKEFKDRVDGIPYFHN